MLVSKRKVRGIRRLCFLQPRKADGIPYKAGYYWFTKSDNGTAAMLLALRELFCITSVRSQRCSILLVTRDSAIRQAYLTDFGNKSRIKIRRYMFNIWVDIQTFLLDNQYVKLFPTQSADEVPVAA